MNPARRPFLYALITVFLFCAYVLRRELLLIYVAVLIAVLLSPVVEWIRCLRIRSWHPSRGAAVLILALVLAILVSGFAIVAVPRLARDAKALREQWPQRSAQLNHWMQTKLPFGSEISVQKLEGAARHAVGTSLSVSGISNTIIDLLTTLLVAAYFIVDGQRALNWLITLVPAHEQPRARATLLRAGHRMQHWLGGQALLMLIHGASATTAFALLGMHYFYLLGVFAGVVNIIPVLGPVITLIVAGAVAAIHSTGKLVGVIIFYVLYHNAENAFLSPRIMEAKVRIPAVTIVVALVIGDGLAGILGILISVPTAVLVATLVDEYIAHTGVITTDESKPVLAPNRAA